MEANHLAETATSGGDTMLAAYVAQVDRTLIRENLKLTPDQRARKMIALQAAAVALRRAGARARTERRG